MAAGGSASYGLNARGATGILSSGWRNTAVPSVVRRPAAASAAASGSNARGTNPFHEDR
jgi:hypothetical protein